ncbi:hypothetical protein Salat_0597700 [Sesamum alatum]|uniref:DUF7950 domain-containing protein n=1 Tax=Sesamum alatum TaxID=300844 RepID=A0AAE1YQF3_9LAMI|nr:hypothetical protein Salat_0597700 [Sesamum alatum]
MIQTISPYASARTAEIMSRYRPIAPKPESPSPNSPPENETSALPNGIRKSPYLRNVWAHLQARPTRTRKRGRSATFAPPSLKRTRTCLQGLSPPYQVITTSPAKNLAMHGFSHGLPQISLLPNLVPLKCGLDTAVTTLAESVALPLLCCTAAAAAVQAPILNRGKEKENSCSKGIDLNMTATDQVPEELDFLPQLQEPVKPSVISPRPVRPVGSTIIVSNIAEDPARQIPAPKTRPEEVEEAVEAEAIPAIVSDSNNKVRITNSAYKEMVGQPECGWLDCAATKNGGGGACKRIGGEVLLRFEQSEIQIPSTGGFSCRVKIEWESKGKKNCVNACCDGVKLGCQAKDYQFLWRFRAMDEA